MLPSLSVIAGILFAVLASTINAQEPAQASMDLARATELRTKATELFHAGSHEEAASLLAEADAIYAARDEDHAADRAVVLRALTYNQTLAKNVDGALGTVQKLAGILAGRPELHFEIDSAWSGAFWENVISKRPLDEALALLERGRKIFEDHGLKGLIAQTQHQRGSLLGDAGRLEDMAASYRAAIGIREKIEDWQGLAWSLNNLGHYRLVAGHVEAALEPLARAMDLLVEGRAQEHARAIAINVRRALESQPDAPPVGKLNDWLWALAERIGESRNPVPISPNWLIGECLRREASSGRKEDAWRAASRARQIDLRSLPPECQADVTLRVVAMAIDGGHATDAVRWLTSLEVGSGPCSLHLLARSNVQQARAHAQRKEVAGFRKQARAAVEAFEAIGDLAGLEEALETLHTAAAAAKDQELEPELGRKLDEIQSKGKPGGRGTSASSSGGDVSLQQLGPFEPVFELSGTREQIIIKDLVTGRDHSEDVVWQPASISFQGLSVVLFGGYVRFHATEHARASSAASVPGTMTLGELGEFWVLSGSRPLRVTKHGTFGYAAEQRTRK